MKAFSNYIIIIIIIISYLFVWVMVGACTHVAVCCEGERNPIESVLSYYMASGTHSNSGCQGSALSGEHLTETE